MYFNKTTPEFDVTNLNNTINFYKTCGFKIEYERPEDRFVFMSLGEIQFMFCELKEVNNWETGKLEYPFGRGINFQLEVDDVDIIYNNLKRKGYPIMVEMAENWYRQDNRLLGSKEFLIQDPDGYLLRFTKDLGIKNEYV